MKSSFHEEFICELKGMAVNQLCQDLCQMIK